MMTTMFHVNNGFESNTSNSISISNNGRNFKQKKANTSSNEDQHEHQHQPRREHKHNEDHKSSSNSSSGCIINTIHTVDDNVHLSIVARLDRQRYSGLSSGSNASDSSTRTITTTTTTSRLGQDRDHDHSSTTNFTSSGLQFFRPPLLLVLALLLLLRLATTATGLGVAADTLHANLTELGSPVSKHGSPQRHLRKREADNHHRGQAVGKMFHVSNSI